MELNRYIDREKKLVRSVTGELAWDYARGLCTLDVPRAQGGTGLLSSVSPIQLRDVTIQSKNPYGTVLIVSLDEEPLAPPVARYVQVGTRARATGWADHAVTFKINEGRDTVNGRQIDDTGQMPWVIEATMVTITVRNAKLTSATLLDINGNAKGRVPVRRVEGAIEVELPMDAMYVILRRRSLKSARARMPAPPCVDRGQRSGLAMFGGPARGTCRSGNAGVSWLATYSRLSIPLRSRATESASLLV